MKLPPTEGFFILKAIKGEIMTSKFEDTHPLNPPKMKKGLEN